MTKASSSKTSIEKNLQTLETLLKKFESGKMDIDKGIEEYEKAAKLIKEIKKELTEKEMKIEEIRESIDAS